MQFTKVEFESRDIIENFLPRNWSAEFTSSEMTFNNIYIWRNLLNTEYAVIGDCLVLRNTVGGEEFYRTYGDIVRLPIENPTFYALTKPIADKLLELYPDYSAEPLRQYADYVYETADLINLSGKKYHSKRNHYNAFLRENPNYKYVPLNADLAHDCIQFFHEWKVHHKMQNDNDFRSESKSLLEILSEFDKFKLDGGVLYDENGCICAFTLSEQLAKDVAVVHFEKASNFVRGAYAAINKLHLEHTYSHLKYVNREDDGGVEGLRKAKESYKPKFMVQKYKIAKG